MGAPRKMKGKSKSASQALLIVFKGKSPPHHTDCRRTPTLIMTLVFFSSIFFLLKHGRYHPKRILLLYATWSVIISNRPSPACSRTMRELVQHEEDECRGALS